MVYWFECLNLIKYYNKGGIWVRHRKRQLNKIVSIIMVFLMVAALFIQPVSAEQASIIAETLEPTRYRRKQSNHLKTLTQR